jgi:AraC-like DNA-binding protein
MIVEIFNFLMIPGIILGIFLIVSTTLSKKGRDKSVVRLNLVVLFLTLYNLQLCLVDYYFEVPYFVRKMIIPWALFIMPSIYSFLTHYLKVETKIYSFVKLTIILFAVEIAIRIVLATQYWNDNNNYIVARYAQIEEIFNAVFMIFILGKCFVLVFHYSKLYHYLLKYDNMQWLKNFLFLGSIAMFMWVVAIILNLDKVVNPTLYIYYPLRVICTIIIYWLGYQGFFYYILMADRIELREKMDRNDKKPEFIAEPKNPETQKIADDEKFHQIKNHIQNNKRYLDANFSLEMLSDETEISVTKLSNLIKSRTNCNFSDYINQFRVDDAKIILLAKEYEQYTIVSVGLECGFNSKSAFYLAFKKFTNMTPSEYKFDKL